MQLRAGRRERKALKICASSSRSVEAGEVNTARLAGFSIEMATEMKRAILRAAVGTKDWTATASMNESNFWNLRGRQVMHLIARSTRCSPRVGTLPAQFDDAEDVDGREVDVGDGGGSSVDLEPSLERGIEEDGPLAPCRGKGSRRSATCSAVS